MSATPPRRRGRPPKFGRPATLVAFALPNDVLETLRGIDRDVGRAIVQAVEGTPRAGSADHAPDPLIDLVRLHRDDFLIVVDRARFPVLPGVAMVPVSARGALLALDGAGGLPELELAIRDALDDGKMAAADRAILDEARRQVRAWRQDAKLRTRIRHILVLTRGGGAARVR